MNIQKCEKTIEATLNIPEGGLWTEFEEWVDSIGREEDFADNLQLIEYDDEISEFGSMSRTPVLYFEEPDWVSFDKRVALEIAPFFNDIVSCRFLTVAPESLGGCHLEIKYLWYNKVQAATAKRAEEIEARNAKGVVFDNEGKNLVSIPTTLKSFVIPPSVRYFNQYAFSDCTSLEEVSIPEGVETLEWNVFGGCHALRKVNIPSTVKRIEAYAFCGCTALEPMQMPRHLEHFGHSVFKGCPNFSGIPVLSGDGKQLLAYYNAPIEVDIPEGVEEIMDFAFDGCHQVEKVRIPASVTIVHDRAFWGCLKISEVEIASNLDLSNNKFLSMAKSIVRKNS